MGSGDRDSSIFIIKYLLLQLALLSNCFYKIQLRYHSNFEVYLLCVQLISPLYCIVICFSWLIYFTFVEFLTSPSYQWVIYISTYKQDHFSISQRLQGLSFLAPQSKYALCSCTHRSTFKSFSSFIEITVTAQKLKFSIKDFFSKCDRIRRKLRIWSHLLKKSLMENFIFCAVI